jgi:hypothetical protein
MSDRVPARTIRHGEAFGDNEYMLLLFSAFKPVGGQARHSTG